LAAAEVARTLIRDHHFPRKDGYLAMTGKSSKGPASLRLIPDLGSHPKDGAAVPTPTWLRVEPVHLLARHRWIRLRYSSSFFDDPVRPLIRFETRDGETIIQAMNGPVLGSAEWVGRVPNDTVAIAISPSPREPFGFRLDGVAPVSRLALLGRGMVHDPMWAYWTVRSRLVNSRQEAWQALKFASRPTPIRDYGAWRARFARAVEPDGLDRPRSDWSRTPSMRFLIRLNRAEPEDLKATVASLMAQGYPGWSLGVVIDEQTPATTLAACYDLASREARLDVIAPWSNWSALAQKFSPDDRIGVLHAGDLLPDYGLAVIAEELARAPDLAVIYSDEDALGAGGTHHDPIFKPDWSPVFQKCTRYVGHLAVTRFRDLKPSGAEGLRLLILDDEAMLDRVLGSVAPAAVGHLRRVLYHRRAEHHEVVASPPTGQPIGTKLPVDSIDWPMVGVVVPTRDRADLLAECVRGLTNRTDYPRCEIIIVDNGSNAADALALLRDLKADSRFRVLERPGRFNFSALSNDGAQATRAPVLVFLNNDIVMLESNWLKPLVRLAVMPGTGVVGAKLLFPDGRIQHAGVVLGFGGIAGHLYRRMPAEHRGYCGRLTTTHEVAAVTGACIAIERAKFEAVRGFDADNLPIDLNDIDLCLRVAERGWTNLWTPDAVLVHLQSATRGIDPDPFVLYRQERTYFVRRWADTIRDDPYFHPAFSLFAHDVALP
jgi:GT2 family glycosyltransferase